MEPNVSSQPPSLLGLGPAWTRVGYGVLVLAVLAFALNVLVRPIVPAAALVPLKAGEAAPKGYSVVHTVKGDVSAPPGYVIQTFAGDEAVAYPAGYRLLGGGGGGGAVKATPLGMFSFFILVFSALAGLVWTLTDIVDRRKRFVWLLPAFVCPLLMSLQAIPLALYLFYGRETAGHGEDVK